MERSDVLVMKNITKVFPGVTALKDVNFSCREGEVHALMGENGAGKSTLIKLLSGASKPTSGEIFFKGEPLRASNPNEAQKQGIAIIYQELNLVPNMNAVENIFLGREMVSKGVISFPSMRKEAKKLLDNLGVSIDLKVPIKKLSVAQQQMIEIAKALSMNSSLIVMDEPTASLTTREIESLYRIIRSLKEKKVTVIFISHHLDEVFEIADRVTVLKDGEYMGTKNISEIDEQTLIKMMVGRNLEEIYPCKSKGVGEKVIEVKGIIRKGVLDNVSFHACKGEIVGIAGLVGSGRTELVRAVFGADRIESGEILVEGKKVSIKKPGDAVKYGIGFATEDRKVQGLVLGLSVKKNVTLPILKKLTKFLFIKGKDEKDIVASYIKKIKISTPGMDAKAVNLSGGNQQKVVLSKWLASECKVMILDEPTRGIDVGAKVEIYNLMRQLANEGTTIIMVSSEMPEILGMSDRILVMRGGQITGELAPEGATEERILQYAMGGNA